MDVPGDDSITVNRAVWTESNARYTDARATAAWQQPEITWGVWQVPEARVRALPPSVAGLDVVELGCGTAYVSAWLARRGARPVGVDPTPAQLATARRCQQELGLTFPLVEAPGERVPLPDGAFDLAVSEYGASIWADPTAGFPRRHACSGPAAAWSSCGTRRWRSCAVGTMLERVDGEGNAARSGCALRQSTALRRRS